MQSEYEIKEKELDEYEAHMGLENKWMKAFLEFRNTDTLTRKMAVTLLERVELYEDRRIHIVFKFRNEYEYLKSNLVKEG